MGNETIVREPELLDPSLAEELELDRSKPDSYLVCVQCNHVIGDPRDIFEILGRREHAFINPIGTLHQFRSYREALGCAITGARNRGDTWFPGYTWRLAMCSNCGQHMGWFFESNDSFYGIIKNACKEVRADDL